MAMVVNVDVMDLTFIKDIITVFIMDIIAVHTNTVVHVDLSGNVVTIEDSIAKK